MLSKKSLVDTGMMLVILGYELPTEALLASICACMHVYVHARVCVCMYVCMYVCMLCMYLE